LREDDDKPIALDWEIVPPEHRDSAIREFLNRPNPVGQPGNEVATFIAYAILVTIGAVVMILVRGV
jgi:hypothetical protein